MKGLLGGNGTSTAKGGGSVDTLIGRQTEILGDVRFSGGLHLDGRIKGNVTCGADKGSSLSISETGAVEGDVRIPSVYLNGTVTGDVHASEKLTIDTKGRVTGSVYYRILKMEPGATINGQLVHEGEPVAALTHQKTAESAVVGLDDARRSKAV